MGPAWVDQLALVTFAALAAVSLARLVVLWRHLADPADVVAHAVMAAGMAAMALPGDGPVPTPAWVVAFTATAAWAGLSLVRPRRPATPPPAAPGAGPSPPGPADAGGDGPPAPPRDDLDLSTTPSSPGLPGRSAPGPSGAASPPPDPGGDGAPTVRSSLPSGALPSLSSTLAPPRERSARPVRCLCRRRSAAGHHLAASVVMVVALLAGHSGHSGHSGQDTDGAGDRDAAATPAPASSDDAGHASHSDHAGHADHARHAGQGAAADAAVPADPAADGVKAGRAATSSAVAGATAGSTADLPRPVWWAAGVGFLVSAAWSVASRVRAARRAPTVPAASRPAPWGPVRAALAAPTLDRACGTAMAIGMGLMALALA